MQTLPQETRPKPNYVGIFLVLVVLTALEVGVTYLPVPRIPVLVPLAIAKAALVVMFYMHLRFDNRLFTVIFVIGVLMGVSLILSLLALFAPPLLDVK
jgi:cytochrome c oxidase subunit 4